MNESGTLESSQTGDVPTKKTAKKDKKKPVKKPDPKPTKDAVKEIKVNKKIAAIKEEQARRREEEERIRIEEEEEERKYQEELKKAEEKKRLETERRERRKQKEKEKKMRLKAEGKLLTEKQKEDRRKAMELAQSRGLDIESSKDGLKNRTYSRKKKQIQAQVEAPQEVPQNTVADEKPVEAKDSILDDWEDLAEELHNADQEEPSEDPNESLSGTEEIDAPEILPEMSNSVSADKASERALLTESQLTEEDRQNLIKQAQNRLQEKYLELGNAQKRSHFRAGVICVLGHVDTGKTKILDKLRNTNVQDREAGGITQQIGATNVPYENIIAATKMCDYFSPSDLKLPGLLIIDTPGHESFTNMRVRGSSLCDFAILVVDLMHGIEEQTKESIKILRSRKTPFVVALNKIDRLYQWKSNPQIKVELVMQQQDEVTINDFKHRLKQVIQDFAMVEINVELFYKNVNPAEYISLVPTSAHTGDGMGDLLAYMCLEMQRRLPKRLTFTEELMASVMEVKEMVGLGTSLDVIVVNGRIQEGDTIVLAGQAGPIVTNVRGILVPAPMSELRVKGNYDHIKEVVGAQGVKIIAKDLELALAGLPLYVAKDLAEELFFKDEVSKGLLDALKAITVSPVGVYVVASTLGSLESLLVYLKSVNIPYSGISVGTVHKKDVMKASVMVERDLKWAVILAFDVKVDKETQRFANEVGVKIFTSEIIYHLQKKMEDYMEDLMKDNRKKHKDLAVFPVKLTILPDMIFNTRNPIIMGVRVEAGLLREGTPICVPTRDNIMLGRVTSIESNHKNVMEARVGQEVCVSIAPNDSEAPRLYGRHFDHTDYLISKISRESIDIVKEFFRNDLNNDDWKLMVELKKLLSII